MLRTIRFDNESRYPDFSASTGVIGFGRVNNDLYIYLDDGSSHTVALTDTKPESIYLAWGSHYVERFSSTPDTVSFESYGYGRAEFIVANLLPATVYTVTIRSGDAPMVSKTLSTDDIGMLTINHPFLTYHGRYQIHITKRG
jgi:hypothetical protein